MSVQSQIVHLGSVRVSLKSHDEKLIINMQSPKIFSLKEYDMTNIQLERI
jgi:hypothetical protein